MQRNEKLKCKNGNRKEISIKTKTKTKKIAAFCNSDNSF